MTVRYVDSAATGSNNGTSWANAFTTLAGAAAVDTAGDVIYVKNTHSESTAGAVSLSWAGTAASPVRVICVSDSNEPPTTIATGAVVATTGGNNISMSGRVYFYGIRFKAGDSTNAADIDLGSSATFYDSCALELAGNNSGSDFVCSNGSIILRGCTIKVANTGSNFAFNGAAQLDFINCSLESASFYPSPLFAPLAVAGLTIRAKGCDWSNLSSSANLTSATGQYNLFDFVNCKLPASWSGSVNNSTPDLGSVFRLFNCDSADTNYRLELKNAFGIVTHETTLKRTGGASDGTTGIAWKMVSNADAEWNHQTLDTPEIVRWNEKTGVSVTATIEIVHDSVTNLTDKEIWLEAMYLGTSGYPLGSVVSDAAANYLSSGADQTASTETWTTTGLTNPNKQKLSVTFTPQEKGTIRCVVKLAKASKTVYVDPKLNVTY